jgi:ABC-type multidrug transport system fused ATPase/permease subunit
VDHGTVVASGSHEALLRGNALYRALWDAQQVSTKTAVESTQ